MNQAVLSNKQALVSEITDRIKNSDSTVVCEYRGLSVAEVTELRRNLRAEDVEFKVYKNTMVERACDETGFGDLKDALTGPNAFAFSKDATAPARVLAKFDDGQTAVTIKDYPGGGRAILFAAAPNSSHVSSVSSKLFCLSRQNMSSSSLVVALSMMTAFSSKSHFRLRASRLVLPTVQ